MDTISSIKFTCCPDTEVDRIIYTCRVVADGFYKEKGFLVLPQITNELFPGNFIVLPDLNYSKYPDFWKKVGELKLAIPTPTPRSITEFVKTEMNTFEFEDLTAETKHLTNRWHKIKRQFIELLKVIFPNDLGLINSVEVRLTNFGTISSFSILDKPKDLLIIYIRKDADLSALASMIINAIVKYKYHLTMSWEERMAVKDFLMLNTGLKSIFPKYQPLFAKKSKFNSNYRKISDSYLGSLKVTYKHKPLELINGELYIDGKKSLYIYSKKEIRILNKLIIEDKLVSFDTLADCIWKGNDEYYSLWAINKTMQRLRNKLVKEGLLKDCILTIRKQGYMLNV